MLSCAVAATRSGCSRALYLPCTWPLLCIDRNPDGRIRLGTIGFCYLLDSWYYGKPTFTPLNFYRTNVANNISLFYGANAWHYYLTQGIPFDLLALLPFFVNGLYATFAKTPIPALNVARNACIWTISFLSLISHKEFRFIQPLLPSFHCLAAYSLLRLAHLSQETAARSKLMPSIRKSHVALILGVNIPAIVFFIVIHMRGQVDIMRYLHVIPQEALRSVGFLMPCHSTPWQSHLHRRHLEIQGIESGYGGRIWALTCEPPLE